MFKGNERNKSVGWGGQSVVRQLGMQEGKLERQEGSLSACLSVCLSVSLTVCLSVSRDSLVIVDIVATCNHRRNDC